jgi:hypothetical protein
MQRDFHYDLIFALAKEAGYTDGDANIIAYASQYTDDNTDREYLVNDTRGEFFISFPEQIGTSGDLYLPIITQAADITAYKIPVQRYIFAPFHFIPGDNNIEIKGRKNPLCTTRGCRNASDIVALAMKSRDLYRVGVALHAYADTWAHERFSAFHEDWNRVYKSNVFKNLPPNIGHAEVFDKPDEISTTWVDERFGAQKIDNRERALLAAEQIFGLLKKGKANWSDVKTTFETIIYAGKYGERIGMIKDRYQQSINDYDKNKWMNEALTFTRDASETQEPGAFPSLQPGRPRFVEISVKDADAHWFRFQAAAKSHLAAVLGLVKIL